MRKFQMSICIRICANWHMPQGRTHKAPAMWHMFHSGLFLRRNIISYSYEVLIQKMATGQNTFHAVLFDLDGTLIDTTQAILESFKYTIRYFTGITPKESDLRPYMGLPLLDQFALLLPDNKVKASQVYVDHNLSIHKKYVKPFPGVTGTLKELRAHGIKLGLVTSKRRHTATAGLEITGIQGFFDAMVFCDDTIKHKPDPAPVLKALDILGYNTGSAGASIYKVLMVGDSPSDIKAARNAHRALTESAKTSQHPGSTLVSVQSAGVTYGAYEKNVIEQEKPDYVLDGITQVLTLCGLAG